MSSRRGPTGSVGRHEPVKIAAGVGHVQSREFGRPSLGGSRTSDLNRTYLAASQTNGLARLTHYDSVTVEDPEPSSIPKRSVSPWPQQQPAVALRRDEPAPVAFFENAFDLARRIFT